MPHILLAEDEPRITSFVASGLEAAGCTVEIAATGPAALEAAGSGRADLMVLDIGLPALDGFEVLRRLRARGSALPVIILTARDSAEDTVAGFEEGANDYMPKPFRFDELLVRIRARLGDSRIASSPASLVVDDLELDYRARRLVVAGRLVDLSAREFALAEQFLRNPDQVLSREQLLSRVWALDFDPASNVVEVYVRYLRRKIGSERIATVRGMGYRLVTPAPG
ncbi:response regulator transcription factor [Homoserinibacter sp. YIM 151385]|uniref:response regulator transcription factor n=1 Tax=Homoserinibacter sp. YIM 151385 TaxID=2985506 RepID=UPI0022F0C6DE|nr:response regulator transcription factor [Homoserinibacter sp. YIM 151385]WBU37804.1 response regulator transcription factor [Homoserinibacter sp. YIM 151385]